MDTKMNEVVGVIIADHGEFSYESEWELAGKVKSIASFPLYIIRVAWHKGCDFEAEADGFGLGFGTQDDWSAIRDSSDDAKNQMLQKAINYLDLVIR